MLLIGIKFVKAVEIEDRIFNRNLLEVVVVVDGGFVKFSIEICVSIFCLFTCI